MFAVTFALSTAEPFSNIGKIMIARVVRTSAPTTLCFNLASTEVLFQSSVRFRL